MRALSVVIGIAATALLLAAGVAFAGGITGPLAPAGTTTYITTGPAGTSTVVVTDTTPSYSLPSAPTLRDAIARDAGISIYWTVPASDGGTAIAYYRVYRAAGPGTAPAIVAVVQGDDYLDANVAPATGYVYSVAAVNGVGEGPRSNEIAVKSLAETTTTTTTTTPAASVPGPPTVGDAAARTDGVRVSWRAPFSDGGSPLTGFRVYRGTAGGTQSRIATLGLVDNFLDVNTVAGTTYDYSVTAVNAVGEGAR